MLMSANERFARQQELSMFPAVISDNEIVLHEQTRPGNARFEVTIVSRRLHNIREVKSEITKRPLRKDNGSCLSHN